VKVNSFSNKLLQRLLKVIKIFLVLEICKIIIFYAFTEYSFDMGGWHLKHVIKVVMRYCATILQEGGERKRRDTQVYHSKIFFLFFHN
jgi:hypothetical protein